MFADTQPLSQSLSLINLNNFNLQQFNIYLVLSSKTFNEFYVVGFITVFCQDNIFSFELFVFVFDGFAHLMKPFSKERISIRCLNDSLQDIIEIDWWWNLGHWQNIYIDQLIFNKNSQLLNFIQTNIQYLLMQNDNVEIKLLLTRHGETQQNKTQIICGQMPGNLTKNGIEQARMIGSWFQKQKKTFDYIYVSDLKRTRDTYQNIQKQAKHLSEVQKMFTPLLREKSGGILEGKPLKTWKEQADKQKKTIRQYKCKNSQSWQDVNTRATKFIQHLVQKHIIQKQQEKDMEKMLQKLSLDKKRIDILAVSHGGFIMEFHNVLRVLFLNQKAIFDNTAHNCSFHQFIIEYPSSMLKYDPKHLRIKCITKNFTQHLK